MGTMAGCWRIILAALMVAAATTGCSSSDRVPGCAVPSNEPALLDELAKEPVLDVAPAGATKVAGPRRQTACHQQGEDLSRTSVRVAYDLSRDPTADELRALFEPVATKGGWMALPIQTSGQGSIGTLLYCRDILDQPGLLAVDWEAAKTVESGGRSERIPAHLVVTVIGSADGGLANLEASRKAVGCQA